MKPDDMTREQMRKRADDIGDAELIYQSCTFWGKDGNVTSSPETRASDAAWDRALNGDGKLVAPPGFVIVEEEVGVADGSAYHPPEPPADSQ